MWVVRDADQLLLAHLRAASGKWMDRVGFSDKGPRRGLPKKGGQDQRINRPSPPPSFIIMIRSPPFIP